MLVATIAASFLGAYLLFLIEPMAARQLLPAVGGAPAVWGVATVFYQSVLLAGYAYAALLGRLPSRVQLGVHVLALLASFLFLPPDTLRLGPPPGGDPTLWLLVALITGLGLPFLLLCATSILVQRWFFQSAHTKGSDPYFLYAASNVGSLLGLLSYPFLLEPLMGLSAQRLLWAVGYGSNALLLSVAGCWLVWKVTPRQTVFKKEPLAKTLVLRWIGLASIPASLMLSVALHVSTDVAAVPLLWVGPLALYLVTFILAFAFKATHLQWSVQIAPFAALLLIVSRFTFFLENTNVIVATLVYWAAFFIIALACHSEIARTRPGAANLGVFYVWLALGGVLGGLFSAIVSPLVFSTNYELPLALVGVLALVTPKVVQRKYVLKAAAAGLLMLIIGLVLTKTLNYIGAPTYVGVLLLTGLIIVPAFFTRSPLVAASTTLSLIIVTSGITVGTDILLQQERSFFGIHRVVASSDDRFIKLAHGTTVHGLEERYSPGRPTPLSYYFPAGPLGDLLNDRAITHLGLVGLGAGAAACYASVDTRVTIFEIDPTVVRIARDSGYFSYLAKCAPEAEVVLGDARLRLESRSDTFDVLILDAYSSDAIPMHLVTQQAFQIYLQRLSEGGLLAVHTSNKHLTLVPFVCNLATSLGGQCRSRTDTNISAADANKGHSGSQWVVITKNESDLPSKLVSDERWKVHLFDKATPVWTDDRQSLLQAFR